MDVFPVINSTLSAKHVGLFLSEKYDIDSHITCKLFRTGINHTYIVTAGSNKFVFRIYSHNWRSELEIREEIRLLNLLGSNGVAVSYPVQDRSGCFIQAIPAPEGVRFGVLFSFAEGNKVRNFSAETSHKIGALMAQIHQTTHNLTLQRINYTPYTLVQLPYTQACLHFSSSNEQINFIKQAGEFFATEFEKVDQKAVRWGAVHLDIWYDNMAISEEAEVTLFDFDFCGNGYLFYDIAYFIMQLYHTQADKQQYQLKLDAFFAGYQTVTAITPEEKKWLPLAGLGIWIFYLGVQSQRFDNWSNIFLSENYLKHYIGLLKQWLEYNKVEIPLSNIK
jgi:Ser/Thr protein kinase RdoA (MazF antagonist)